MRAVLVVNPQATATTPGGRDVLAHALASEVKLDVVETTHRGHAAEIGAAARPEGIDLVVAHGGDGTVNEVVNGMLPAADGDHAPGDNVPMLAVVPGGSANVFARALGYPPDPVEATHVLLEALALGRRRRIGLGTADARWFTFSAGMGWDADVVSGVDRIRGKEAGPGLYTRVAVRSYFWPAHSRPELTLTIDDEEPVVVRSAFISNADPWSYFGPRPIRLIPGCSFERGIGVFAPRSLDVISVLGYLRRALSASGCKPGRRLVQRDDVLSVSVTSEKPVNLQVDGDLVGEKTSVEFRSVTDALTVVV
ncbi:MAG: diacylglycerol kinase family lipid kinase [Actinophytocola sp.]|nr:diacylglycerol kinase family lipid kinase [Actinophytocola sp.]